MSNGGTKTSVTKGNVSKFMFTVKGLCESEFSNWYSVKYLSGHKEMDVILVHIPEYNRMVVLQPTGEFLTLCKPTIAETILIQTEQKFCEDTQNFSGEAAKNQPPERTLAEQGFNLEENFNLEGGTMELIEKQVSYTLLEDLEGRLSKMTPNNSKSISADQNTNNLGVTPVNSFETDVMNISPTTNTNDNTFN